MNSTRYFCGVVVLVSLFFLLFFSFLSGNFSCFDYFFSQAQQEQLRSQRELNQIREDFHEVERSFWRNVTLNPAIYGADTPGIEISEICEISSNLKITQHIKKKHHQQKNEPICFGFFFTIVCSTSI